MPSLQPDVQPKPPTGADARRQRQRAEARRAILEATESQLVQGRGDDFSIRAVASQCGYSAPTIYHYFGDKDGLIDALLEERFTALVEQLQRVELGVDPLHNLRRLALTFVEFGVSNPPFYRMISTLSRKGQQRVPPPVEKVRELLTAPTDALAAQGRLRTSAAQAVQSLWALMHGLALLRITRPDHPWSADVTSTSIDAMLRGLTSDQGAP